MRFNWQHLSLFALVVGLVAVMLNQSKFSQFGSTIAHSQSASTLSQSITIAQVKDGDTVKLSDGRDIRFCGVDAPETAKRGKPGQPMGEEAKNYLQKLVNQANGQGYLTPTETDRYGRTVGEIVLRIPDAPGGEVNANTELILSGHAWFYRQYSKCPNADRFEVAEERAARSKLGVHKNPGFEKPWDFRKRLRG